MFRYPHIDIRMEVEDPRGLFILVEDPPKKLFGPVLGLPRVDARHPCAMDLHRVAFPVQQPVENVSERADDGEIDVVGLTGLATAAHKIARLGQHQERRIPRIEEVLMDLAENPGECFRTLDDIPLEEVVVVNRRVCPMRRHGWGNSYVCVDESQSVALGSRGSYRSQTLPSTRDDGALCDSNGGGVVVGPSTSIGSVSSAGRGARRSSIGGRLVHSGSGLLSVVVIGLLPKFEGQACGKVLDLRLYVPYRRFEPLD